MKSYKELSHDELLELQGALNKEYADAKSKGLSLNMARGKPSPEQLGFSMGIMDVLNSSSELVSEDGTDCRNYGVLDGIPEAKRLMAGMRVFRLCMIQLHVLMHLVYVAANHGASRSM